MSLINVHLDRDRERDVDLLVIMSCRTILKLNRLMDGEEFRNGSGTEIVCCDKWPRSVCLS